MRTHPVIIMTDISVRERRRFSLWPSLMRFYNRLPLEIAPCRNEREAKIYTVVLLCVLAPILPLLIIPAAYIFLSSKKGGRR